MIQPEDYIKIIHTENPRIRVGEFARVICVNADKTILVETEKGLHDTLNTDEWREV